MIDTPECDKITANREESRILTDFYDWLGEHGLEICAYDEKSYGGEWLPDSRRPEQLFADYFGIDMNKVEEERRAILELQRELNYTHDILDALSSGEVDDCYG